MTDKLIAIAGAFNDLESYFSREDKKMMYLKEENHQQNFYPFIPENTNLFVSHLIEIRKLFDDYHYPKFLDVGCGPGTKLLIAQHCKFTTYGIEIDGRLANIATSITPGSFIFNKNALDFKSYRFYDVIYYFCPIKNIGLQIKLEKRIEQQMKIGAILFPVHKKDLSIHENKHFEKMTLRVGYFGEHYIYRKIK